MMLDRKLSILWCMILGLLSSSFLRGQDEIQIRRPKPQISSLELAEWIDARFEALLKEQGVERAPLVDDATFMRRVYLDLVGTIPTVSQVRDFLEGEGTFKRPDLVDRLIHDDTRPERYATRGADHMARIFRRVMIPPSSPGAMNAAQFDNWLRAQFAGQIPYDEFARRLITSGGAAADGAENGVTPAAFYQAVGATPVNMANSTTRIFLGVRIGCAQCHDHPFNNDLKQQDFWGMAAFFSGNNAGELPTASDEGGTRHKARFLWGGEPTIDDDQTPRQVLAEWIASAENPNFAATAVNRIWQHLCGEGLYSAVNDLDQASEQDRELLDELAGKFAENGFHTWWLIEGICKSKVYQRASMSADGVTDDEKKSFRPLKTLAPEQVFDSLEQTLSLPIGRVDNGPRHNGLRTAFVARINESIGDSPVDYRAGIPQALMIMNGSLTADATDLNKSRTLRAVVDAPFLNPTQKIEALYLATFTRMPRENETRFLLKHISSQPDEEQKQKAYAEVFWGMLNSPEYVLSR